MVVTMKEEQNTLEYQETVNVDIGKIPVLKTILESNI